VQSNSEYILKSFENKIKTEGEEEEETGIDWNFFSSPDGGSHGL